MKVEKKQGYILVDDIKNEVQLDGALHEVGIVDLNYMRESKKQKQFVQCCRGIFKVSFNCSPLHFLGGRVRNYIRRPVQIKLPVGMLLASKAHSSHASLSPFT